ncbi:MAG: hypothetical protein IPO21_00310 [Bacteroidales bacterium]|nr:hypothetical protein [Bacteroidales bacterium]
MVVAILFLLCVISWFISLHLKAGSQISYTQETSKKSFKNINNIYDFYIKGDILQFILLLLPIVKRDKEKENITARKAGEELTKYNKIYIVLSLLVLIFLFILFIITHFLR